MSYNCCVVVAIICGTFLCVSARSKVLEPRAPCGPHEFSCQNVSGCIPLEWACDNERDCPDTSDEDQNICNHIQRRGKRKAGFFPVPELPDIFNFCSLPRNPQHGFYVIPDCQKLTDNVKLRCVKSKTGIAVDGLVIEFYCKYGFELVGSHKSTCKEEKWVPPVPSCEKLRPPTKKPSRPTAKPIIPTTVATTTTATTTTTTTTSEPTTITTTKSTTIQPTLPTTTTTEKDEEPPLPIDDDIETDVVGTTDTLQNATESVSQDIIPESTTEVQKEEATSAPSKEKPTISMTKIHLTCPSEWELHDEFCYYISDFRVSWQTARQACKQTDRSADLVSLHNGREQDYLTEKMFWQLWIGLGMPEGEENWKWSDGSPVDWQNWGRNESESSSEARCTELHRSQRWNARNCADKLRYACHFPSDSPMCPESWEFYQGNCYYVSSETDSWESARQRCKQLNANADLASIHGKSEQAYIAEKMYWQLWLGLNNLEHPRLWEWSDSSPTNFINWQEGERSPLPSDRCVTLWYTQKWTNVKCNDELKFACKMRPKDPCNEEWKFHDDACYYVSDIKLNWEDSRETCKAIDKKSDLVSIHKASEQEFLTEKMYWEIWIGLEYSEEKEMWLWTDGTPLNTTQWEVEPHGEEESCAGLLQSGKWQPQDCRKKSKYVCKFPPETPKCPEEWNFFQGFCYHLSEEKVTWDLARKKCKELERRSELVCFHNRPEQRYLTDNMFWRLWIGLNDVEKKGQWEWSDNTPTNFISWKERKPYQPEDEQCAELYFSGTWNSIKCGTKLNFACKVQSDPCPLGWNYLMDSCYYVSESSASWEEARDICKNSDKKADLVSFRKPQENTFVTRKLLRGTVWIGLEKATSGAWKWSDSTQASFFNWHLNEPSDEDEPKFCAGLVHSGSDDKDAVKWSSLRCSEKNYFACKMREELCPERWDFHNNICYYLSDYQATWQVAREVCKQMDISADLLSIESLDEQNIYTSKMILRVWLGLKNTASFSRWKWSDGSPLTFLNWKDGEPNNLDTEMCTELSIEGNGLWNNNLCSERLHFICKLSLELSEATELAPFQMDNVCPSIEVPEGVEVRCLSGPDGESIDCSDLLPPGSEAHFQCSDMYESTTWEVSRSATCLENGLWSEKLGISCRPACGKSGVLKSRTTTLMHHGYKAIRGQWPWHAGIYRKNDKNQWMYHCGGSLIGSRFVLTASHCVTRHKKTALVVQERRIKVFLGKYYRQLDENDKFVQSREVQAIYSHYGYHPGTLENDITILVLKSPVEITNYVRPICYPKEKRHSLLSTGKVGVVAGWGTNEKNQLPNDLYMASFPVANSDECHRTFNIPPKLQGLTYCAGYRNGTSVCNGDSGGGMVFPASDNRWYLEGLVSYGLVKTDRVTCDTEEYSVFTRVTSYLDWIAAVLADAEKDNYEKL